MTEPEKTIVRLRGLIRTSVELLERNQKVTGITMPGLDALRKELDDFRVPIQITGRDGGCCHGHGRQAPGGKAKIVRLDTGEDITESISCVGTPSFPWLTGARLVIKLYESPQRIDPITKEVVRYPLEVVVAAGH